MEVISQAMQVKLNHLDGEALNITTKISRMFIKWFDKKSDLQQKGKQSEGEPMSDLIGISKMPQKDIAESVNLKNAGDMRLDVGDWLGAEGYYRKAIAIDINYATAYNNLGLALMEQGQLEEAEKNIQKAIELKPDLFNAHYILGLLAYRLGKLRNSIEHFTNATRIKDNFAEAFAYVGMILLELGDREGAASAYQKAVSINPDSAESYSNLAIAIQGQGKRKEAIRYYRRALELAPNLHTARLGLIHQMQQICEWETLDTHVNILNQQLPSALADPESRMSPFSFLALPGTTELAQKMCAEKWTRNSYRAQLQLRKKINFSYDRKANEKIKVGYLSADFHNHATAVLMAKIFELHDRQRFHVTAYSYGPDDDSDMRSRIEKAFDEFVDIGNESMIDSAKRIFNDRIDILVDLKGYTGDTRSAILALLPAPIQISFLGYPGTMGCDFVDYLIADRFVIPEKSKSSYTEKIAYLPDCYQPNDNTRPRPPSPTRASQKLPENEVVFCCFNQSYKITAEIFDVWCRILAAVPGSLLWLLADATETQENLRKEAKKRNIESHRIIFAPRVEMEDHLARLQCADIFLDTIPYNAHTTCSEALWMGLPVVTCVGETFAARVAGSLLSSLKIPELITYNLKDYFELALALGTDREKRAAISRKIVENGSASALFDSEKFTRNLEDVYFSIYNNEREINKHFQIIIVNPPSYLHSQAFIEIAETIQYGLRRLGLNSTIAYNTCNRKSINIILGSNLLAASEIDWIPSNSIIYNLEQIYPGSPWVTPTLLEIFGKFQIWDYSQRNVAAIRSLVPNAKVEYVPIGYVNELSRIQPADNEDIDVLFYGSLNERRKHILDELARRGVKVEAVFGLYGAARDALIGRAKLVINMRLYDSDIFEIVRVSYLLSNQKAVVSECSDSTDIEADLREAVALAPYSALADTCIELLANHEKRRMMAKRGFEIMSRRTEEKYLKNALGDD